MQVSNHQPPTCERCETIIPQRSDRLQFQELALCVCVCVAPIHRLSQGARFEEADFQPSSPCLFADMWISAKFKPVPWSTLCHLAKRVDPKHRLGLNHSNVRWWFQDHSLNIYPQPLCVSIKPKSHVGVGVGVGVVCLLKPNSNVAFFSKSHKPTPSHQLTCKWSSRTPRTSGSI